MAKTKRSALLDSANKRLVIPVGKSKMTTLKLGTYLLYRRPKNGAAGVWMARWVNPETKKQVQVRLGDADDYSKADGHEVLNYDQAQEKAAPWFKARAEEARMKAAGESIPLGSYSVRDALRDYLSDAYRRGMKGHLITTQSANAHILPTLGDLQVSKLTKQKIEDWHLNLSESARKSSVVGNESGTGFMPEVRLGMDPESKRRRKVTANRVLTILRAALNAAVKRGRYQGATPWREVEKFKSVEVARIQFLSVGDQRKLVSHCEPEFRSLVEAALFTGARYGELNRLRVKDFDSANGTVFIRVSKSGKSRHIWLTEEAQRWFTTHTEGRSPEDLLLKRTGVNRRKRRLTISEDAWAAYDQVGLMAKSCEKAGIAPLSFHELRHTYASVLVNRGVPLAFVAAQLGHTSAR